MFSERQAKRDGHRAGLNRGVPLDQSTHIIGGSFRRGLILEVITFSKSKMAASYFVSCLLIGPNGFTPLFSFSSMEMAASTDWRRVSTQYKV